mmetsp:Transcript_8167/g.9232  ORF Transcript_8167/g.9232 Transcript_8167/m.9232 type:complete len:262 (-) Transcript_8167:21-806(-)
MCLLHAGTLLVAIASRAQHFSNQHMLAFTAFIVKRLVSEQHPLHLASASMELTQPMAVLLTQFPLPFLTVVCQLHQTVPLVEEWLYVLLRSARDSFPDCERLRVSIVALLHLVELGAVDPLPGLDPNVMVVFRDGTSDRRGTPLPWFLAVLAALARLAVEAIRRPAEFCGHVAVRIHGRTQQSPSASDEDDISDGSDEGDHEDKEEGSNCDVGGNKSSSSMLALLSRLFVYGPHLLKVQNLFSTVEQDLLMHWLSANASHA